MAREGLVRGKAWQSVSWLVRGEAAEEATHRRIPERASARFTSSSERHYVSHYPSARNGSNCQLRGSRKPSRRIEDRTRPHLGGSRSAPTADSRSRKGGHQRTDHQSPMLLVSCGNSPHVVIVRAVWEPGGVADPVGDRLGPPAQAGVWRRGGDLAGRRRRLLRPSSRAR